MRDRGKAKAAMKEASNENLFSDFNYSVSSDMPCKKHPSSSSVGICSYCLKDRLVNLMCSECGEQRLSSCSCSDFSSSNRNSCSVDVGSVGRISFLLENDKIIDQNQNQNQPIQHSQSQSQSKIKTKIDRKNKQEQVILLRRSSSSCVEIKKNRNGFWKIKKLFKKKIDKNHHDMIDNDNGVDEKSDIWVSEVAMGGGVSRSRSLCSFRNGVGGGGGAYNNDTDEGSDYRFSSAKISDVTTSGFFFDSDHEPRKSGIRTGACCDTEDLKGLKKGFVGSEVDQRVVPNRSIFPVKESDFSSIDDSAFIDLKLDSEFSTAKRLSNGSEHGGYGYGYGYGYESGGGSCRITAAVSSEYDQRGIKSGSGKNKVWKWIFSAGGRKSTSKRDENSTSNIIIKS